jgi:hypothetical protein
MYGIHFSHTLTVEINSRKLKPVPKSEEEEKESALDMAIRFVRDNGDSRCQSELEEMKKNLPRSSLARWEGLSGEQFVADKVELRKDVIDIIGPQLKLNLFESIRLEDNLLDRDGILFAIDLMKQNTAVVRFYLIGSRIDIDEDLNLLNQVISDHPSLRELELTRCFGPNIHPASLSSLMSASKQLKSLYLKGNNISESSMIADFIATNPALQELFLCDNRFNDDDARIIANSLMTNTNLWTLDLKGNVFGRRGCDALLKAIFNHDSLNSVSSSNHTCDIFVSRYKVPCVNGFIAGGEAGAIKAKKFALIATPDDDVVNVHYLLSAAPPELMHKVLEFLQKYPIQAAWKFIRELSRSKTMLELGAYTRFGGLEEDMQELEEQLEAQDFDEEEHFSAEDFERKKAEATKALQIKSLGVLMSVVKGVVVPMFFSA